MDSKVFNQRFKRNTVSANVCALTVDRLKTRCRASGHNLSLICVQLKLVAVHPEQNIISGAGIAQWLERRTRDWKVTDTNPCWSGGRIFFSRVNFLCWLLFRYPFHTHVTTVARKRSRSFCQSAGGRLQLNTHTPYVCGFAWSDMEHGCMVYTRLWPRRLQFHVAPAMPAL